MKKQRIKYYIAKMIAYIAIFNLIVTVCSVDTLTIGGAIIALIINGAGFLYLHWFNASELNNEEALK